jgi:hypothetical protein
MLHYSEPWFTEDRQLVRVTRLSLLPASAAPAHPVNVSA